jgi:cytochrome b
MLSNNEESHKPGLLMASAVLNLIACLSVTSRPAATKKTFAAETIYKAANKHHQATSRKLLY